MTEVINLETASIEHMLKQPAGRRYSLTCFVSKNPYEIECDSIRKMGHLGDFSSYLEARQSGLAHPHDVILRFYPDMDNRQPSDDFLADFRKQLTSN